MALNIPENIMKILTVFLLLIIPLALILIGAAVGLLNVLFYLFTIFWFGMGVIFYSAIEQS
jgi:hypothetical protein